MLHNNYYTSPICRRKVEMSHVSKVKVPPSSCCQLGTLEDRLVTELRLEGISDMTAGNAFLPGFMERFNAELAKVPAKPDNLHRLMNKPRTARPRSCAGGISTMSTGNLPATNASGLRWRRIMSPAASSASISIPTPLPTAGRTSAGKAFPARQRLRPQPAACDPCRNY